MGEIKDLKKSIKDDKETLEASVFEQILETYHSIVQIDDRVTFLSHEDKLGNLDREMFCELLMLRALSHFPKHWQELSLEFLKYAMANMGKLYVMCAFNTYDLDQLGRHELVTMCKSSIVEESQLVFQAITSLDVWFKEAGLGPVFKVSNDGDFPIDLSLLVAIWPSIGEHMESARAFLSGSISGRKRKTKAKSDIGLVRSQIKATLKLMGLEFLRSNDKTRHMYGIFPLEVIQFLVPRVEFRSIDESRADREVIKESVRKMENTYKRFQELIPDERPVGRKRPVAAIDRQVRRRL
jgi:hypothetical protein